MNYKRYGYTSPKNHAVVGSPKVLEFYLLFGVMAFSFGMLYYNFVGLYIASSFAYAIAVILGDIIKPIEHYALLFIVLTSIALTVYYAPWLLEDTVVVEVRRYRDITEQNFNKEAFYAFLFFHVATAQLSLLTIARREPSCNGNTI
ncbi:hypothetical protein QFX18_01850 [Saccharophagus degradans]|uniref:hypothetical protein n=1 Tax=Saccharophagus degradans TaxID=86304 RepID=UPI0024782050|nr:hypothetical protein [Saccharophagus degradans]WGO98804.1 hypothetical protein QFX18_01850 [Saccharophagus degradans]